MAIELSIGMPALRVAHDHSLDVITRPLQLQPCLAEARSIMQPWFHQTCFSQQCHHKGITQTFSHVGLQICWSNTNKTPHQAAQSKCARYFGFLPELTHTFYYCARLRIIAPGWWENAPGMRPPICPAQPIKPKCARKFQKALEDV